MNDESAAGRPPHPVQDIAAAPWRYDFYQALRLIEAWAADKPRLGRARRPADEAVRLGQAADLSFAPASLAAATMTDRLGRPRIAVRFFGLFGPNGPLPLHLSAYARDRALNRGDETLVRFADLFHHRLLLLFYRAWAQAQPTVSLDRPAEDRFADYVGSLLGVGGPQWRGRDALPDHARLAFAGLFARQVRHADGLARVASGYLGMPVRVESFVGRWMPLPAEECTRIGRAGRSGRQPSARLGASAVLGRAVFDRQHHFRLHIGPLTLAAFESLLPVGTRLAALKALVCQYVGLELGWDLRLELQPDQRPPCRLGRGARLGWTSWLAAARPGLAGVLTFAPHPASP
ncbi:MAG: type VI secretion system baseplate subunit TssG [Rubrivivax sp.]